MHSHQTQKHFVNFSIIFLYMIYNVVFLINSFTTCNLFNLPTVTVWLFYSSYSLCTLYNHFAMQYICIKNLLSRLCGLWDFFNMIYLVGFCYHVFCQNLLLFYHEVEEIKYILNIEIWHKPPNRDNESKLINQESEIKNIY